MRKVVTVTGIRPDFIRMSTIFKKLDENFDHTLIHTGQHYDKMLSDVFFNELTIRKPDYNLGIGAPGKLHYEQQAEVGPKLIKCLQDNKIDPDIILFLGDSNSVLSSIPLKKEGYKIGHIEAGMRSHDMTMPEEVNRKACDHVSDLLFVYHEDYADSLLAEGVIFPQEVFNVGNTIVEVVHQYLDCDYKGNKDFILVDIHRHENVIDDDKLQGILDFVSACSIYFTLPAKMLMFSRTMQLIKNNRLLTGDIQFVPLMGYMDFLRAMQDAAFIISDSGTAQEEPALIGTPVIVPRKFTERPQSVNAGNSIMLDLTDVGCNEAMTFIENYNGQVVDCGWLGDGTTSDQIINILRERL